MRFDRFQVLFATAAGIALGCGGGVAPSSQAGTDVSSGGMAAADHRSTRENEDGPSFHIVPRPAVVAGKTTFEWIPEFWRYLLSLPSDVNPELNLGADCSVGQSGPVFFLPGFQARVSTRSCTIPAHTPVLYTPQSLLNDYPCPDPTFQPAPGQTLEDFLAQGAKAFDDAITSMVVTIDGTSIDPDPYRYLTHLFTFTGDPSLTATLDSCVTGTQQVAVVDGWFVILRLSPGDHTLVTTYVNPGGHPTSATFLLHVLGDPEDD
jgi:hypothetical protein